MRAGRLRHRVIVQQRTDTQDTHGEPIPAWTQYGNPYASVAPVAGGERTAEAELDYSEIEHDVGLRHLEGLDRTMRLLLPRQETTLNGSLSATVKTITVTSAAGFPTGGREFRILVESELMNVKAGHGTTSWTVERAQDGTTGATHADAVSVELMAELSVDAVYNVDERDVEMRVRAFEEV